MRSTSRTYLACRSEHEGKTLALKLWPGMNLGEIDIMFQEIDGFWCPRRLRKYVHQARLRYGWRLRRTSGEEALLNVILIGSV